MVFVFLISLAGAAFASVEATGEGPSKQQALAMAMRRAVEQDVGVFVNSSTAVVDSMLVDDKILSHSSGYVTGYKILRENQIGDAYTITISAQVDSKMLKDDLDSLTILKVAVGNPRILVAFSKKGEGAKVFRGKDFVDDIYNGIVESLTDLQFRVVDKSSAEKFAQQVASTHDIDVDLNKTAAIGLKYNAEYTLLYSISGEVKEGSANTNVRLRIKTQLIDNTRSQVVTSKQIEQTANAELLESALEKAGRDGGKKAVKPMIEALQKNWMDAQQNGQLFTVVIDAVENADDLGRFTSKLEKFPLVSEVKEVESGGGKATFEATYKGKRDQLDRDVIRAATELGWTMKKIRSEGARSTWKKQ